MINFNAKKILTYTLVLLLLAGITANSSADDNENAPLNAINATDSSWGEGGSYVWRLTFQEHPGELEALQITAELSQADWISLRDELMGRFDTSLLVEWEPPNPEPPDRDYIFAKYTADFTPLPYECEDWENYWKNYNWDDVWWNTDEDGVRLGLQYARWNYYDDYRLRTYAHYYWISVDGSAATWTKFDEEGARLESCSAKSDGSIGYSNYITGFNYNYDVAEGTLSWSNTGGSYYSQDPNRFDLRLSDGTAIFYHGYGTDDSKTTRWRNEDGWEYYEYEVEGSLVYIYGFRDIYDFWDDTYDIYAYYSIDADGREYWDYSEYTVVLQGAKEVSGSYWWRQGERIESERLFNGWTYNVDGSKMSWNKPDGTYFSDREDSWYSEQWHGYQDENGTYRIDGVVDPGKYTLAETSGSVIITITFDESYLRTLRDGVYNINANFELAQETVTLEISENAMSITATNTGNSSGGFGGFVRGLFQPDTGSKQLTVLWIVLSIILVAGLAVSVGLIRRRRRNNQE